MIKVTCDVCGEEISQDVIGHNAHRKKKGPRIQIEIGQYDICDQCHKRYADVVREMFLDDVSDKKEHSKDTCEMFGSQEIAECQLLECSDREECSKETVKSLNAIRQKEGMEDGDEDEDEKDPLICPLCEKELANKHFYCRHHGQYVCEACIDKEDVLCLHCKELNCIKKRMS
jgi:hypothetical protein